MPIKILNLLLLVAISPIAFGANIYKCKNSSGEVEYSNAPCLNSQTQKNLNINTHYNSSPGLRPGERRMLDRIEDNEAQRKQQKRQAYAEDRHHHIGFADRERIRRIRSRELSIHRKLDKNPTLSQAIGYRKELDDLQRQREDIVGN